MLAIKILITTMIVASLAYASPIETLTKGSSSSDNNVNDDDMFSTEVKKKTDYSFVNDNKIRPVETEEATPKKVPSISITTTTTTTTRQPAQTVQVAPTLASSTGVKSHISGDDLASSIAHNSREVRLVGPDQREVEMKEDAATRAMIALENFQKDAEEMWGTVTDQVTKGWNELKKMLNPQQQSTPPKY